jgi:hypothetical protein
VDAQNGAAWSWQYWVGDASFTKCGLRHGQTMGDAWGRIAGEVICLLVVRFFDSFRGQEMSTELQHTRGVMCMFVSWWPMATFVSPYRSGQSR